MNRAGKIMMTTSVVATMALTAFLAVRNIRRGVYILERLWGDDEGDGGQADLSHQEG